MKEKTLIVLDGTKFGEAALHYMEDLVDKLAPGEKPDITLLKVISPPIEHISVEGGYVDIVDQTENLEKARAEALDYLEQAAQSLRSKGITVHSKVVINDHFRSTSDTIVDAEEEFHADMVAMSAHKRNYISRLVHHNTAENVSLKGKAPVLLVRAN